MKKDYDKCSYCKQVKHKSDFQIYKSYPLKSLCGRCSNMFILNPTSYKDKIKEYDLL